MRRQGEFSDKLNNNANFKGFTALHYAVLADSMECVKILLEAGANPTVVNEAGHRPEEYARHNDIQDLLNEYSETFDEIMRDKVCCTSKLLF